MPRERIQGSLATYYHGPRMYLYVLVSSRYYDVYITSERAGGRGGGSVTHTRECGRRLLCGDYKSRSMRRARARERLKCISYIRRSA